MKTITYTADGVQKLYSISFAYEAEDVFTVYVDDSLLPFEKIDHNHTIKLLEAPALGARIKIVCASCIVKDGEELEKAGPSLNQLEEPQPGLPQSRLSQPRLPQLAATTQIDQLKQTIHSDIEPILKDFKTNSIELLAQMDKLYTKTMHTFENCHKLKAELLHEMSSHRQSIHQLIQEGTGKLQYDASRIEGVANHAVNVANQRWSEVNSLQQSVHSLQSEMTSIKSELESLRGSLYRVESRSGSSPR
ncbi:MAG: hypothetical protein J0G29_03815 [Alphaproteobacteria bacterium]|nr:hypothetical protein [Alphaproteobacteria bacterium]OJV45243.1 MAG: hypothetical protein BGO28_00365 [Alphaproteobacteria bacterium 43-37]